MRNKYIKTQIGILSSAFAIVLTCHGEALAPGKHLPHGKDADNKVLFSVCGKLDDRTCAPAEHVALDDYQFAYTGEEDGMVATYIRLNLSKNGEKRYIELSDRAAKEDKVVSLLSCDHRELASWHIMDQISKLEVLDVQLKSALEDVVGLRDIINCKSPEVNP